MPAPEVEDYSFGRIVVDGETYTDDLILLPERVLPGWWREEGHRLAPADLDDVIEESPERLVLGTGARGGVEVPAETEKFLEGRGIELVAEDTWKAVETYDEERGPGVVGAFHLTC